MAEKLPKEKIELFDRLIKALSLALTNSALYPANHPTFIAAMGSLKDLLDKWLQAEAKIELGISPDNILLDGAFAREDSDLYKGVADNLHRKGIIALVFIRGIAIPELLKFFTLLKEANNEKSGITRKMGALPHLVVKEVDYSSLLTRKKTSSALHEQAMWQSLSDLGEELKKGQLPESKVEFMTEFLKDPKKAASVLNRIYKESAARLEGQSIATEIRDIFAEMNRYFEKNPSVKAGNAKQDLSEIISKLDPDLVVSLFKDGGVEDGSPDLANDIFKELPDESIASFMSSVMKSGGNVNEKTIRVFNRLASGKNKSDSILPMVTDKLFNDKLLGRDSLSMLQGAIKNLFESHPDDGFVSQLYDLTVGAFLEKEKAPGVAPGRYSAVINEYSEFLKPDNLKREKMRLLLNILWLEHDAAKFRRTCEIMTNSFHDIPDLNYAKTIKEIFELLTEKLGPDRKRDTVVARAVQDALDKIDIPEVIDKLICLIPGSDRERLEEISYVLIHAKESRAGRLLDLLMAQKDDAGRNNFGYVLSRFDGSIAKSIVSRLDSSVESQNAAAIRQLYGILKSVDSHEAHAVAGRLIKSRDRQVRVWILDEFCPESVEEKDNILKALRVEADPEIKKKLLITLVKTKDIEVIKQLSRLFGGGIFKSKLLVDLVTLCGTFKAAAAIPFLKNSLERRPFFYTRSVRMLRTQSVLSLARIGTPEALECVMKAAGDRDPSVRAMCKMAIGSAALAAEKVK